MLAPIHRLTKDRIQWLSQHRCEAHRHSYLTHYACYMKEAAGKPERVGHYDIEASNLDADFGIMLSWAIMDNASGKIYSDTLRPEDIRKARAGDEDRRLLTTFIAAAAKFDRLVGFYSSCFDSPFLRTRALSMGLDYFPDRSVKHTDLYFQMRGKLKMSSKRLENMCRVILGKTDKTRIENRFWRGGARGDRKSLAYILDHNIKDVKDLRKLYQRVLPYMKLNAGVL